MWSCKLSVPCHEAQQTIDGQGNWLSYCLNGHWKYCYHTASEEWMFETTSQHTAIIIFQTAQHWILPTVMFPPHGPGEFTFPCDLLVCWLNCNFHKMTLTNQFKCWAICGDRSLEWEAILGSLSQSLVSSVSSRCWCSISTLIWYLPTYLTHFSGGLGFATLTERTWVLDTVLEGMVNSMSAYFSNSVGCSSWGPRSIFSWNKWDL